jgi:cell division protein FtsI/penicillin-binding protein 2
MITGQRRGARLTAVTLTLVLVTAALAACSHSDDRRTRARSAAEAFLAAWSGGRFTAAARRTDHPGPARTLLRQVGSDLSVTTTRARLVGEVGSPDDRGRIRARTSVTMTLATLGTWTYSSRLTLHQARGNDSSWLVTWSPAVVHPRLTATTRLSRARALPPRAPVLDRDGVPLMRERPVVDIGIEPRRLADPARAYAALARLDVDPTSLRSRVEQAPPDQFVPVITLRKHDFAAVSGSLHAIPGLVFRDGSLTLAPTATFGRALLGTVRPASKETLAAAGPLASAVDDVGTSGLQLAFQRRLAGQPSGAVLLERRTDGATLGVLHRFVGHAGTPLRTTLDARLQAAAERALAAAPSPAAMVAVRPSTGEVLAAASTPADSTFDRAVVGRYAPGSTFKVVSTAALLRSGLHPSDTVNCPLTVTVDGKQFKNYDDLGSLGAVPFSRDFAESCNTAFIGATTRLPRSAIAAAARLFGLGNDWRLGTPAFSGSVPPADSSVEQAADTIGQGKVEVSPLAMAMVAAAVESGTPHIPVLLRRGAPEPAGLPPLPRGIAPALRGLMRETVRSGTATVVDLPGTPVGAKTGTAEFGTATPPKTHAWLIGYRGDLAFAVLVEEGDSGSHTAGPVARQFLEAVTR